MGPRKKLFLVQDDDRPIYIVSENWKTALNFWRNIIASENDLSYDEAAKVNPQGIKLVCEENDVFIDE